MKSHLSKLLPLVLCLHLLLLSALAADEQETDYAQLHPVENHTRAVTEVDTHMGTLLENTSILFFGDSLTSGYGLESFAESWVGMLGSRYGMEVTCHSISGSTMATAAQEGYYPGGSLHPMAERPLPVGDFDIIFVEGGGNDWYCAIPIGDDLDSRDTDCFYGALNTIIDRLTEAYPSALLVCMTSWEPKGGTNALGLEELSYDQAMEAVCDARAVPCYQAYDPERSGIYTADPAFRQEYCIAPGDGWHLNPKGQARFLPTIASWLEAQCSDALYAGDFWDVPKDSWYGPAVQYAKEHQIVNGVSAHSFAPDLTTTRAMLVTMLHRAVGTPAPETTELPFADVDLDSYYGTALCWAYGAGVVNGVDATHFAPEEGITREQLFTILHRYHLGGMADAPDALPASLADYTDVKDISPYAQASVAWGVENGLIQGTGDRKLSPGDAASRAQIVTLLHRYLEAFPVQ